MIRRFNFSILLLLAVLVLLNCSEGKSPVEPEEDSRITDVFQAPWDIFGMNAEDDPGNPDYLFQVANEVDMAPLVYSHGVPGSPGDLVTDESGNSFVAVVSRVDEMEAGEKIGSSIELKIFSMRQKPGTAVTEPILYSLHSAEDKYWGSECNYDFNSIPGYRVSPELLNYAETPRVIARVIASTYPDHYLNFEVHVAYEVPQNSSLVIYRGLFRLWFKDQGEVDIFANYEDPDHDHWDPLIPAPGISFIFPDLEYSPQYWDTHLVYTQYKPLDPDDFDAEIHWRYRSGSTGVFSAPVNISLYGGGTNAWIPRIDVGTVTDPYGFEDTGDVMTVAVVYTRQQMDVQAAFFGYRSYVRYWKEVDGPGPGDNANTLPIVNGVFETGPYYGNGLPVIDIAPESNYYHDAYVAFTQQVDTLPNPVRHAVYVVGHAIQSGQLQPTDFYSLHDIVAGNGVLPALCIHHGTRELSVTYYYQMFAGGGPWTVMANRADYLGGTPIGDETMVDTEAFGNFNIADLVNYNFGLASGIASCLTYEEPSYFAAWSDSVGIVCEPCHIQATYGYTAAIN